MKQFGVTSVVQGGGKRRVDMANGLRQSLVTRPYGRLGNAVVGASVAHNSVVGDNIRSHGSSLSLQSHSSGRAASYLLLPFANFLGGDTLWQRTIDVLRDRSDLPRSLFPLRSHLQLICVRSARGWRIDHLCERWIDRSQVYGRPNTVA